MYTGIRAPNRKKLWGYLSMLRTQHSTTAHIYTKQSYALYYSNH